MSSFTVFASREEIMDMYEYDASVSDNAFCIKETASKNNCRQRPRRNIRYDRHRHRFRNRRRH